LGNAADRLVTLIRLEVTTLMPGKLQIKPGKSKEEFQKIMAEL
jgi:hypothetical protein